MTTNSNFFISRALGRGNSEPNDVLRVRKALNRTGHVSSPPVPSRVYDGNLSREVTGFQVDFGLKEDGVLLPGGPTDNAIKLALEADRLAGPAAVEAIRAPFAAASRAGFRFMRAPGASGSAPVWRDADGKPVSRARLGTTLADARRRGEFKPLAPEPAIAGIRSSTDPFPRIAGLAERVFGRNSGALDEGPSGDQLAQATAAPPAPKRKPGAKPGSGPSLKPRVRQGRWVVPLSKASGGPTNPTKDPFPSSPITPEWRFAIHDEESEVNSYQEISPSGHALGRYQMTPPGLKDAGMIDANGRWTGKYGIHSKKQFLNDPVAQEKTLVDLMKRNEGYISAFKMNRQFGSTITIPGGTVTVTRNGMLAAMHRHGNRKVQDYFGDIVRNGSNTTARTMDPKFREIEKRLLTFENVPYSRP